MTDELEKQLQKKYPQILQDIGGDPMKTCMAFGLEIGGGWYKLLDDCMAKIMATNPPTDFKASQIKSKFGGLRFYTDNATVEIDKIIDKAEAMSYDICEGCGSTEVIKKMWTNICANCSGTRKQLT